VRRLLWLIGFFRAAAREAEYFQGSLRVELLGIVEKADEVTWSPRTSQIKVPRARLPDGNRIYAVGDIHGRLDLLDEVIARIDADMAMHPASNTIRIFLGDYIDRGPNSKGVLDRLVSYCAAQPTVCLTGNHEAYLREFLECPEILSRYGGLDTLRSYGLAPQWETDTQEERKLAAEFDRLLPPSHREFLSHLKQYFICR